MIQTVSVEDLKVGMYVILSEKWLDHDFLKSRFLIKSEAQLEKLRGSGVGRINVDTSRSLASREVASITHPAPPRQDPPPQIEPPEEWRPEKNLSEKLKNAIDDKTLPPKKKAQAVYEHSRDLMESLLENPTSEFIAGCKRTIGDVVDLILSDDETSLNLLRITSHDFYTYTHSVNVGILSVSLAKRLYESSPAHNMRELGAAFFLHDLGKTRIDTAILNKPGRLDEAEMKRMRAHPYQGYKILEETSHLSEECAVIVMQHHEREDGTGYPRRLRGDEIHDYGRICCIADIYDALTAERSYKRALTPYKALRIMKEEMLGHFHEKIFETFVLMLS